MGLSPQKYVKDVCFILKMKFHTGLESKIPNSVPRRQFPNGLEGSCPMLQMLSFSWIIQMIKSPSGGVLLLLVTALAGICPSLKHHTLTQWYAQFQNAFYCHLPPSLRGSPTKNSKNSSFLLMQINYPNIVWNNVSKFYENHASSFWAMCQSMCRIVVLPKWGIPLSGTLRVGHIS